MPSVPPPPLLKDSYPILNPIIASVIGFILTKYEVFERGSTQHPVPTTFDRILKDEEFLTIIGGLGATPPPSCILQGATCTGTISMIEGVVKKKVVKKKVVKKKVVKKKMTNAEKNAKMETDKKKVGCGKEKGTKKTAKKDEDERVLWICDETNTKTELGISMKKSYLEKFGREISKFVKTGNHRDHYDIIIHHTDGSCKKCEEKGTKAYSEIISDNTNPYENSVQFYNGPASKFSICKKYLRIWYDDNVDNDEIMAKYDLPETPTFDEWLDGGPNVMWGDPKSKYSKMLKTNYRQLYPKRSMGGASKHNEDYRIKVNEKFHLTDQDKIKLINEVQEIYTYVMDEKEVWLQTTGTVDGPFSFKWFDKIESKRIIDVEMIKKKDIEFRFILEDKTYITGLMRWGNGCGFSCFRMDLR